MGEAKAEFFFFLPIYFMGFSLGGLVGVDIMTGPTASFVHFDRMVLLAPALSIHTHSYLVQALEIFGPELIVPSLNNEAYRANATGTSMAAYKALFDLIADLKDENLNAANIPALVLLDPEDELVSESGLKQTMIQGQLTQWKLLELTNATSTLSPTYHHLIIDEPSLGTAQWSLASQQILALLK